SPSVASERLSGVPYFHSIWLWGLAFFLAFASGFFASPLASLATFCSPETGAAACSPAAGVAAACSPADEGAATVAKPAIDNNAQIDFMFMRETPGEVSNAGYTSATAMSRSLTLIKRQLKNSMQSGP